MSGALCVITLASADVQAGFKDRVAEDEPVATDRLRATPVRVAAGVAGGRQLGDGLATWYGPGFHGRRTASGERFNAHGMTAAHRSLAFGTRVKVVHQGTGRSVVVRINDRGPHRRGAVIDLSQGSARALGMGGVARVRIVSADE